MTITTHIYKTYTIDEHPNKEACYEWIRNNWHDLGDHCLEEAIVSLKALALHLGLTLDYSISMTQSRGEYVSFDNYNRKGLARDYVDATMLKGDCPLTGVCYDEDILDAFRQAGKDETLREVLNNVESNILSSLHSEGEYMYSDEGLYDLCEANEYEFKENGEIE